MSKLNKNRDHIFAEALQLPVDRRAAYLKGACGDNEELRRNVEDLLGYHDAAGSFLLNPPQELEIATTDQSISEGPGSVIGRYELIKEIGEGGFGVVYMAEQHAPVKRIVALKIIKPGMDTKAVVARFGAEHQALALMEHPNIAKVFDAGSTDSGRPYFVMELVDGVPITNYCDSNRLATHDRLRLFATVCRAAQHAHQKGVIHRDLKPSNVMISLRDSQPTPVIFDFGVSKSLNQGPANRTLFTGPGQMLGTPLYMSPEQAAMDGLDIDTRSDIYSLGVLLYELMAGSTPVDAERIRGTPLVELQRVIREEEAPPPSARLSVLGDDSASVAKRRNTDLRCLQQTLRGDLDWIVMKALAKDRERRYATANDFANDIERFIRNEAIEARPPSIAYKLAKFARRNRSAVAVGVLVASAILLGILGTTTGMIRANRARIHAEENSKQLQSQNYRQLIRLAQAELHTRRPAAALRLLNECPTSHRNWEWRYLYRLSHSDPLIPKHLETSGRVLSVDFSPTDGNQAAVVTDDGSLILLSLQDEAERRVLVVGGDSSVGTWSDVPPTSVRFSPLGNQIAFSHGTNPVSLREIAGGEKISELKGHGAVTDVAFHPHSESRELATAGSDATLKFWSSDGNRLPLSLTHDLSVSCVAYSPDGRFVASGSFDRSVVVWSLETGQPVHRFRSHTAPVTCLAFSHDGRLLATGSIDREGILWDLVTGKELLQLRGHQDMITGIAFSSDDTRIATASTDHTVRLWEMSTGEQMLELNQKDGNFSDIAFSQDGYRMLAASRTKSLTIWDSRPVVAAKAPRLILGHEGRVWDVAVTREGDIVSAAEDGTVRVWDRATSEEMREFNGHGNVVFDIALHPDGKHVASVGPFQGNLQRHGVIIWDRLSGEIVDQTSKQKETGIENREFHCVDFSPDGRWLVTAGVNVVRVWDLHRELDDQEGKEIGRHEGVVWSARFSPCGRHLATAGSDGAVKLWNAEQLNERQTARSFPLAKGHVTRLAFSPNGGLLAFGDSDGSICVIDTAPVSTEISNRSTWSAHGGRVRCVEFSPDGRFLASGGADETVKIWDVKTQQLIRSFLAEGTVYSLAFGPDGKWLAAGDGGMKVRIWDSSLLGDR